MSQRRPTPPLPIDIGSVVGADIGGAPVVYTDELGEAAVRYNLATCPDPSNEPELPLAARLRAQDFFHMLDRRLDPDMALSALRLLIEAYLIRNGSINRDPELGVPTANPAAEVAEQLGEQLEQGFVELGHEEQERAEVRLLDTLRRRVSIPPAAQDAVMAGQDQMSRIVLDLAQRRLGEIDRELRTMTALGGLAARQHCGRLVEENQIIREAVFLANQLAVVNQRLGAMQRLPERGETAQALSDLFGERNDLQRRIGQRLEVLRTHFSSGVEAGRWSAASPPVSNTPRTEQAPDTVFVTVGDLDGLLAAADLNLPVEEEFKQSLAETIVMLARVNGTRPTGPRVEAIRHTWGRWLPVKQICDRLLQNAHRERSVWMSEYSDMMDRKRWNEACEWACWLKAAALVGTLAQPYLEESTVLYRPEQVFLNLRAEQALGDWPTADILVELYDALHQAVRDTPDALCFPGDGVCNLNVQAQSQPDVYRKIRRKEPS